MSSGEIFAIVMFFVLLAMLLSRIVREEREACDAETRLGSGARIGPRRSKIVH